MRGSTSRPHTDLPCATCRQSYSNSQLLSALLGPAIKQDQLEQAGNNPPRGGSGVESSSAVIAFGSFIKVICIILFFCLVYIYYPIVSCNFMCSKFFTLYVVNGLRCPTVSIDAPNSGFVQFAAVSDADISPTQGAFKMQSESGLIHFFGFLIQE